MLSAPVIKGIEEIGPYQLQEDLGPAPFGTAYLAVDTRSDQEVLLKVIPPSRPGSWQEDEDWEILLGETAALARIYHPGIPVLSEVARHDGALLVAFAPIEGQTLHERLARGERPDRDQLIDWGCQLLELLAEAHAEGILHRHLGEEEVLVTPGGSLALTGFGLTRLTFDPPTAVPPECLAGEPFTVQGDLYGVGLLLRHLAFVGGLRKDPVLKVLARATFPDPRARYGSAREMADALREAGRSGAARRRSAPPAEDLAGVAPIRRLELPGRRAEDEERDLWRAFLLLMATLLLMVFVLAAGWLLIAPQTAPKTKIPGDTPGIDPRLPPAPVSGQNNSELQETFLPKTFKP
jgi:hypothetical protein